MSALAREKVRTLLRSAAVGIVSTFVDLATLEFLVQLLKLTPAMANLPALTLGVATQFIGNKVFAFGDRAQGQALAAQSGQFALVELGALILNALIFHLLVTKTPAPFLAARLFASALVYFGYSYPLWGRIFKSPEAQ